MNFLAQVIPYLPYLLLAIVLVIVCLLVVLFLMLRKARKAEPLALSLKEDKPKAPEESKASWGPLARLAEARTLRTSFSRAIKFLRDNVAGRDYLYQIPWFMVVGESCAGKTTLLDSAGIRTSLVEEPEDFGIHQAIQWRFFNQGILLDIYGEYLLRPDDLTSDDTGWETLLKQLQSQRARRPIDGIVIALPCTDFLAPHAQDIQALEMKAARLCDKLWRTQKILGLSFPVYVVVTKCDAIRGFRGFCQELPAQNRQDIFGWSSPYGLATSFIPAWVDEAFDSLSLDLNRLQGEIFALRRESPKADEVFMFPGEFELMRDPLRIFLARMFKETAYRESFYFRGLYFCGDPQAEVAEPVGQANHEVNEVADPFAQPDPEPLARVSGRLFQATPCRPIFLTRLFEEKIFPESSIARPISRVFYTKSRLVREAQATALLLAIVLGWGMMSRYLRMHRMWVETLRPTLDHVVEERSTSLFTSGADPAGGDPAGTTSTSETASMNADQNACNLITDMHQLDMHVFSTLYIPVSLSSPLNEEVRHAITPEFGKEVFGAVRQALGAKASELIAMPAQPLSPPPSGETDPLVAIENYTQQMIPEFQTLQSFTKDLTDLQRNIDLYESLRQKGEGGVNELQGLTSYLKFCNLPPGFEGTEYSRSIVQQASSGQRFNEERYVGAMSNRLKQLVGNLFNAWFTQNPVVTNLAAVQNQINGLEGQGDPAYQDLKNLDARITLVKTLLSNPAFAWISKPTLNLSNPYYKAAIQPLQGGASRFFDPSMENWIQTTAESDFENMKSQLQSSMTDPTGNLLQEQAGGLQFSPGTLSLRVDVENLLNLPFMTMQPTGTMSSALEPQTQLIWNPDPLNEALSLYGSYKRFTTEGLRDSPFALRTEFERIARTQLESNMLDLIGRAQTYESVSSSNPGTSSGDDDASELKSFEQAETPLSEILTAFRSLGLSGSYAKLQNLTTSQAVELLSTLDAKLTSEEPYVVKDGNFYWWQGESNPALMAFDVRTQQALENYLTFKRQRIASLATEADPLINFLGTHMTGLSDAQARTYYKWRQIIASMNAYNQKIPGNPVATLQDFIRTDMNKYSPDQYCQGVAAGNSQPQSSNFFLQSRDALRQGIDQRCKYLADLTAYRNYSAVAKLFNRTLAGKFPFSLNGTADHSNEADPEAIRTFYQAFDAQESATRKALTLTSRFGPTRARALSFLNAMEKLRPLFASLLSGGNGARVMALDFVPTFRVNEKDEIGGNQIIGWALDVGDEQFQDHQPAKTGRWQLGEPVSLTLQWAKDSPALPAAEKEQSDLHVDGRQATFQYTDAWSLLSLIREHHAPVVDFADLSDPHPYTLQFTLGTIKDIATTSTTGIPIPKETRVFIRLAVMQPGKKESLSLPSFPTSAPLLIWTMP